MGTTLTKEQAAILIETHEIRMEDGDEETELLVQNNPELAEAYYALLRIAAGE